jgi:hypothetical protein
MDLSMFLFSLPRIVVNIYNLVSENWWHFCCQQLNWDMSKELISEKQKNNPLGCLFVNWPIKYLLMSNTKFRRVTLPSLLKYRVIFLYFIDQLAIKGKIHRWYLKAVQQPSPKYYISPSTSRIVCLHGKIWSSKQ